MIDLIDFQDDQETDRMMDEFAIQRRYKTKLEKPIELTSKDLQPEEFLNAEDFDLDKLDKAEIGDLLLEEMECPICLISMTPPKMIFACTNAHLFCQNCKIPALKTCPKCREDFANHPPSRCKLAERWACEVFYD